MKFSKFGAEGILGILVALPVVTHSQARILGWIASNRGGPVSGATLRGYYSEAGESISGPSFYLMMARLEKQCLVKGSYEVTIVNGTPIKERRYTVTDKGTQALTAIFDFYDALRGEPAAKEVKKRTSKRASDRTKELCLT